MVLKLANNAATTLNGAVLIGATSIVVANGSLFPALGAGDWFPATLTDALGNMEVVLVTARATNTLTVVRGQEGTAARAWNSGDRLELRMTNAAFLAIAAYPQGHLFGLAMANNATDATNDIDFTAGIARDGADTQNLVLTSALTKQLDVAWAAGNNAGGRMSAAALTNTTYFCFIIAKPDGTADVGFDTSPTAPTLPSGYTTFRRIGAIVRAAGTIVPFLQDGDYFSLKTPAVDSNVINQGTSATLVALASVPSGIRVRAKLGIAGSTTTTGALFSFQVGDPTLTADNAAVLLQTLATAGTYRNKTIHDVFTNVARQVISTWSVSDANTALAIVTYGWTDTRGRLA